MPKPPRPTKVVAPDVDYTDEIPFGRLMEERPADYNPVTSHPFRQAGSRPTLFLRPFPPYLRDAFKAACYRRGTTMKSELLRYMKEFVRQTRTVRDKVKPTLDSDKEVAAQLRGGAKRARLHGHDKKAGVSRPWKGRKVTETED